MKFPVFKPPRGLVLAIGLSLGFMLVSYARLAGNSQSPIFDHAAYKAVFDGPLLGTALAGHFIWFIVWLSLLHAMLGAFCWLLARATQRALPGKTLEIRQVTALWFIAAAGWLLAWNAGNYPRSSIGATYARLVSHELLGLELHQWLTIAFVGAATSFLAIAAWRVARGIPRRRLALYSACGAIPLAVACVAAWSPARRIAAAPEGKPNVILLGIDSLRYDEVERAEPNSNTPNLDAFLVDAVRFDNAMTPLARTYPSWVSLLTGKHPHTTGAFLNLLPSDKVRLGQTLPLMLRERGYHTAYAIDEVRFSNIDESYGFDEAVTPPIGASDFIVGTLCDTPLLNLVARSVIGKWFFPYGYANRGTNLVYEPDTYVKRIRTDIDYTAPLFLASHQTLPHWPYAWRDSEHFEGGNSERPLFYQAAVRRADQQFGDILRHLEARGVLQNAIVVVFSDHGESFAALTDSLVPPSDPTLAALNATPNWGHGTTVLTPHQYRILLAVRAYGPARNLITRDPGVTHIAASIEDITPTLLDMLKVESHESRDGVSLLPELRFAGSLDAQHAHRIRFTETEFNPLNLVDMTGDVTVVNAKSFVEATHYYTVDPETDRIEMKRQFLDILEHNRQFAAVGWTKMLGIFPLPTTGEFTFLELDLKGGIPPRLMSVPGDFTRDAEVTEIWTQTCRRFGAIIDAGKQSLKCAASRMTAADAVSH
jgi:arylsulfatase A-like enzyme